MTLGRSVPRRDSSARTGFLGPRQRGLRPTIARLVLACVLTGCAGTSPDGADVGQSSCAPVLAFRETFYEQVANVSVAKGLQLGSARFASCGEQPTVDADDPGRPVYSVPGLADELAVAADVSGETMLFAVRGTDGGLPPDVNRFVTAARAAAGTASTTDAP